MVFVKRRLFSTLTALSIAVCLGAIFSPILACAAQGEGQTQHELDMGHKCGGDMDHSKHKAMLKKTGYERAVREYVLPDLEMVDQGGEEISVHTILESDEPVMVNFIFTTCTTICPVMSATFAQVQKSLGEEASSVRMVSVSIDPEHDTPERLREYAKRFEAGPQWTFLTGSLEDSVAVQKAFDVYRGNKMNHEPTTLLRHPDHKTWVRIDGLASAEDIVTEYRRLVGR
jgi:protein SCO1/2